MNSRVHPTYKTKYRVANLASYDRALVGRGDGDRTDPRRRWRPHQRHGGRGLRHDCLLRDGRCPGRDRRGPPDQDGTRVSTGTAVDRGARDRTITRIIKIGRRRWKKEAGYPRQARVENAFFRYKSIIGGTLRARSPGWRVTKAVLACNVLNQMTDVGRPESYRIDR